MSRTGHTSLSVIIPTLNEASVIGSLLRDLAPLRMQGHELILVDSASADATCSIAAPLVDRLIQAPRGRAAQMNAGAALASGDILWFLHADSGVPSQAAATLLDAIFRSGARWGRFDVRLDGRHAMLRIVEGMMNLRSWVSGIATGDQGIFVKRELFFASGGFPEIALMEDIALSKRLKRDSRPLVLRHPRLRTSSRRWERHGILPTILLMWRLRLAYALGADPDGLARRYR